jgi:branched-chain amino acid transport system substrate-binding protein
MHKKIIWLAVLVIVVVLLIGFKKDNNKSLVSNDTETKELTKIGVIMPLSGVAASMGEGIKRTIDLVELDNSTVLYEDDQCDTKKAVSAYNILKAKGVRYFYVPCSGSVLALAPLAKQDNNLIITAYSGSAEIRKTGLEVIRFNPDALSVTEVINSYISENSDKKFAIFYELQDYAKSVSDIIQQSFPDRIVMNEGYSSNDGTFKTSITKIKSSGVDEIIWVPVADKAAQIILSEMQTLNIKQKIVGEVNLCDYPFSPKDFNLHGTCWKATSNSNSFNQFLNVFKTKYGVDSQYQLFDAMTYDSIKILDSLVGKNSEVPVVTKSIIEGVQGQVFSYKFDQDGEVKNVEDYLIRVDF